MTDDQHEAAGEEALVGGDGNSVLSKNALIALLAGALLGGGGWGTISTFAAGGSANTANDLQQSLVFRVTGLENKLDAQTEKLEQVLETTRVAIARLAQHEQVRVHSGALTRDEARVLWQELRLQLGPEKTLPSFESVVPR